jgi:hypothetical protein
MKYCIHAKANFGIADCSHLVYQKRVFPAVMAVGRKGLFSTKYVPRSCRESLYKLCRIVERKQGRVPKGLVGKEWKKKRKKLQEDRYLFYYLRIEERPHILLYSSRSPVFRTE